jgi:hypothetical protein
LVAAAAAAGLMQPNTPRQDKSEDIKRIIGELEDGPEGYVDVRKFEQAFTALLVRLSSSFARTATR